MMLSTVSLARLVFDTGAMTRTVFAAAYEQKPTEREAPANCCLLGHGRELPEPVGV